MRLEIKKLIKENGFKMGEFAKKIGISREYLRLIINGKAESPSHKIMIKIAKELNTDIATIFFKI